MDPVVLTREIERAFLERTVQLMEKKRINLEKSQEVARELIKLLPFVSVEDIKTKIEKFTEKFPDYSNILVIVLEYYDKGTLQKKVEQVEKEIKSNQSDVQLSSGGII